MKKFLSLVGIVCVLAVLVGALSGVTFAADPVAVAEKADGSTVDIADAAALKTAVTNTDYVKVTLKQDVRITGSNNYLTIKHSMTLDLGGHVFEQTSQSNAVNVSGSSSSSLLQNVHVTITNGTIVTGQFGVYTRYLENASCSITVTDMTIVAGTAERSGNDPTIGVAGTPGPQIIISNSTLATVNPNSTGVFTNAPACYSIGENVHLYSPSAVFSNPGTSAPTITAASGELYQINSANDASITVDETEYSGLNYWTTVQPEVPDYIAEAYTEIGGTAVKLADETALQSAVDNARYVMVKLVADVELAAALTPNHSIIIDLGNNVLSVAGTLHTIQVDDLGAADNMYDLTVQNGTVLGGMYGVYIRNSFLNVDLNNLTVLGGAAKRTGGVDPAVGEVYSTGGSADLCGSTFTVKDCTLVSVNGTYAFLGQTSTTASFENSKLYTPRNEPVTPAVTCETVFYYTGMETPVVSGATASKMFKWTTDSKDEVTDEDGDVWAWVCDSKGNELFPLLGETELREAVAEGMTPGYIKLARSIETTGNWVVFTDVTIDLNGRTITASGSGIQIKADSTATVKNGVIKAAMYPVYVYNTTAPTVNLTVDGVTLECTTSGTRTDPALGMNSASANSTITVKDSILISPKGYPILTRAGQTLTLKSGVELCGAQDSYYDGKAMLSAAKVLPQASDVEGLNKWKTFTYDVNPTVQLYMDDPWGYRITLNPVGTTIASAKLYWVAAAADGVAPEEDIMVDAMIAGNVIDFTDNAVDLQALKIADLARDVDMVIEYTVGSVTETYCVSAVGVDILESLKTTDPTNEATYSAMQGLFEAFVAYEAEAGEREEMEENTTDDTAYSYFGGNVASSAALPEDAAQIKTYAAAYLMEPWGIKFSGALVDAGGKEVSLDGVSEYGIVVGKGAFGSAKALLNSGSAEVYLADRAGTRFEAAYNKVSTLGMDDVLSVVSFVETESGVAYGKMYTVSVTSLLEYLSADNSADATAEQRAVIDAMLAYKKAYADYDPDAYSPVLQERRQAAENYLRELASVVWRADTTFTYQSPTGSVDRTITAGKLYSGLPYSFGGGTLGGWLDQSTGTDSDGIHTITGLTETHLAGGSGTARLGIDCSGVLSHAWQAVGANVETMSSINVSPDYGYLRVGDYEAPTDSYSDTDQDCIDNGTDVMYAAYSQLQKADGLVRSGGKGEGHVRFVVSVNVVRTNGEIDGTKSTVTCIEQNGSMNNTSYTFKHSNGETVQRCISEDIKYTFKNLFDTGYLPVTNVIFHDPSPIADPVVTVATAATSDSDLYIGSVRCNWTLKCNWGLENVTITITNASNKVVQSSVLHSYRYTYTAVKMSQFTTDAANGTTVGVIDTTALAAGTYHCKITCRTVAGHELTAREFNFTVS